jgi:hypothetical protein
MRRRPAAAPRPGRRRVWTRGGRTRSCSYWQPGGNTLFLSSGFRSLCPLKVRSLPGSEAGRAGANRVRQQARQRALERNGADDGGGSLMVGVPFRWRMSMIKACLPDCPSYGLSTGCGVTVDQWPRRGAMGVHFSAGGGGCAPEWGGLFRAYRRHCLAII